MRVPDPLLVDVAARRNIDTEAIDNSVIDSAQGIALTPSRIHVY